MRILFINDHARMGGKEKYLWATRAALRERGHVTGSIMSVCDGKQAIDRDEISFSIPGIDTYKHTRTTIDRLRECTSLFKPDVIHMNHNAANLIAVRWLLSHFPVLRSIHDVAFLCPTRYYVRADTGEQCDSACGTICFSAGCLSAASPRDVRAVLKTRISQSMYARWSRLNTQSDYLKANLCQIHGNPQHVGMLPVFVSPGPHGEPAATSGGPFLYVGRLNRWKGPQVAIEALLQLPEKTTLVIAGTGEMEPELRSLVQKHRLERRVNFAGFLEGEALQQQYRNTSAVLLPGLIPENCPMSIQEAMACSRAVIASRVGGIPALVEHGVSGFLVPPNNVAALAGAMQSLLDDPTLCQSLGRNGQRRIEQEQFQREYHVRKLTEEYSLAIATFKRRRPR